MLRILSGYFSDSYFCSSLDSLKIQADEDGVRTIAIVYLICLFFFSPGNLRCPECLEKTLLPDEQFQFFFVDEYSSTEVAHWSTRCFSMQAIVEGLAFWKEA